jgi:hypothetical protein
MKKVSGGLAARAVKHLKNVISSGLNFVVDYV